MNRIAVLRKDDTEIKKKKFRKFWVKQHKKFLFPGGLIRVFIDHEGFEFFRREIKCFPTVFKVV